MRERAGIKIRPTRIKFRRPRGGGVWIARNGVQNFISGVGIIAASWGVEFLGLEFLGVKF